VYCWGRTGDANFKAPPALSTAVHIAIDSFGIEGLFACAQLVNASLVCWVCLQVAQWLTLDDQAKDGIPARLPSSSTVAYKGLGAAAANM
jgi:hypothetical protein